MTKVNYLVLKIVKSKQDAEDIIQDTYIKILEKLPQYQYKGKNSFAAWVSTIASNTALDFLRKKQPTLFSELSEDKEFIFDIADESVVFQPEKQYDKKETSEIVSMLLSELSEEQRICILLFYLQNLSIKEIAEQCQCSENTVKSRLNYGRKKIRGQADVLKKYGIYVGETSMLAVLVYFLKGDITHAHSITLAQATSKAAKVMSLFSKNGGMTTTVVTLAGKVVAASEVKKIIAIGIAGVIVLGGGGGYAVHKLKPFSRPTSITVTATPLFDTPTATVCITPTPQVIDTPASIDTHKPTPKSTKELDTKELATKEPITNEETKVPATKKPTVTIKPTTKPTTKSTTKPTAKPTAKPTEKPVEEEDDGSVEWDDAYVEEEE